MGQIAVPFYHHPHSRGIGCSDSKCDIERLIAMATVTEGQIRELIRIRASADKAFRAAILENPRSTLEEFLEMPLPEGLEVVVVEDTARKTHVVIPNLNDELDDEQLEAISGGFSFGRRRRSKFRSFNRRRRSVAPSAPQGGGDGGIGQSGSGNVACIGKGGLVNSNMEVSGGGEVSG